MKRESGYYNRAARRSGGDRRIVFGGRVQGKSFAALRLFIGVYMEKHPDASIETVASEALKQPGATVETITEILRDYCEE